jgi:hypothetical protein
VEKWLWERLWTWCKTTEWMNSTPPPKAIFPRDICPWGLQIRIMLQIYLCCNGTCSQPHEFTKFDKMIWNVNLWMPDYVISSWYFVQLSFYVTFCIHGINVCHVWKCVCVMTVFSIVTVFSLVTRALKSVKTVRRARLNELSWVCSGEVHVSAMENCEGARAYRVVSEKGAE